MIAVKRAVSRAFPKEFAWAEFDQAYNKRLETAVRKIQVVAKIPASGQYGKLTHEFLRNRHRSGVQTEWAYDAIAINLMKSKWEALHDPPPTAEEQIKAAITDFCRRALQNADDWHYSWARPMSALGRAPELRQYSDCSTGATEAIFWARMVTKINIPDPNGRGWDGYGNTDSLWAANLSRRVSGTYEVGDLALYWAHGGHVTICMEAGSESSALWWSNGSERAPNTNQLHYRSDLRGVVRPRLIV